jgi:uncharacterized protein DUF4012
MWEDPEDQDTEARQRAIEEAWGPGATVAQDVRERVRVRRSSSSGHRSGQDHRSHGDRSRSEAGVEGEPELPKGQGDSRGRGRSRSSSRSRSGGSSRRRRRHTLRWVLLGFGFVVVATGAVVADAYWQSYQIYQSLRDVQPQISAIRAALTRGGIGRNDPFGRAAELARGLQAEVDHTRVTFRLAGMIPVVGRPVDAARLAADAAGEEAAAATLVRDIVVQVLGEARVGGSAADRGAPVFQDGVVDVGLLQSFSPKLEQIVQHLANADRDFRAIPSIPLFQTATNLRDKAIEESGRILTLARRTTSTMKLVPSFLAAGGERTYYLAFQQNAALRGTGGSVLAFGFLHVSNGALSMEDFGGILELDNAAKGIRVPLSSEVNWYIHNAHVNPRIANGSNYSPNFPIVAEAWRKQAEAATGRQIDGVIAMDPFAVESIMKQFAPITVEAYDQPISSRNVVQIVEHDQFLLPAVQQAALPGQLIHRMFNRITGTQVDMLSMLRSMGDSLSQKRLQIWTDKPAEQSFLGQLGWDGKLREGSGDHVTLAQENRIGNKLDFFLSQSIRYTATVKADGGIDSEYQVTLNNNVPTPVEGPPGLVGPPRFRGLNRGMMNLYVPERAKFKSVDPATYIGPGPDKVFPPGFVEHVEGAFRVLTQTVVANPNEPRALTFRYSVPKVIQDVGGHKVYELSVHHQPMVNDADFVLKLVLPEGSNPVPQAGWQINGNVATYHSVLSHDMVLRLEF